MPRDFYEYFRHERRAAARKMVAAMQLVKNAVQKFEDGEINLEDALRQIADAIAGRRAA